MTSTNNEIANSRDPSTGMVLQGKAAVAMSDISARNTTGSTVQMRNPSAEGRIVLVCEHASNHIPDAYGNLGLPEDLLTSHIAWDPGALHVAEVMADRLEATLIAPTVSRLVYDCNRPPESPGAMPERSEIFDIPGNRALSPEERARRASTYYEPFHKAIAETLEARISAGDAPVLVTIHSFTPVFNGVRRTLDIGVLHDEDSRLADAILAAFGSVERGESGSPPLDVRRNEPYAPVDGVTHTLCKQALPRGLNNVMIEIRNDLIADARGQREMGERLADVISAAVEVLG